MDPRISQHDIYDKNGVLLLSKGQHITDEIILRLKRLGVFKPDQLIKLDNDKQIILSPVIRDFGARKNIRDPKLLDKPAGILSKIIFESKSEPWWIYVNALSNYVAWLYTHSVDVAMISLMIANQLGYAEDDLLNLGLGTLLHDVGKLLVPKSILEKPGALSEAEMMIIKQHCDLGISSIERFDLPKAYTDIILYHHEKMDGSGYPRGIKGDEISQNIRIVMIADAIDGITAYRPYKAALDLEGAVKELRRMGDKYPQEIIELVGDTLL